mmetsp:Transcript_30752/g.84816  ORF Transcript_30752/g.84816 Transcript_30752/m.84816 type:complete len:93 (-) Transcript_30752:648-926(-)
MAKPKDEGGPVEWGKDDDEGQKQKQEEWAIQGEVTSRRQHKVSKADIAQAKEEYVSLEWDDVFPKKAKRAVAVALQSNTCSEGWQGEGTAPL